MPGISSYAKQIHKLQQLLHREELKLARLRTKANIARRTDERMKLRLGAFLFVLNWQDLTKEDLEKLLVETRDAIQDPENEVMYRIKGENALRLLEQRKSVPRLKNKLNDDERRGINHHQITLGGMMVKYDYHRYPKSIIFGALLERKDRESVQQPISETE